MAEVDCFIQGLAVTVSVAVCGIEYAFNLTLFIINLVVKLVWTGVKKLYHLSQGEESTDNEEILEPLKARYTCGECGAPGVNRRTHYRLDGGVGIGHNG